LATDLYIQLLYATCGGLLLIAVLMLWRRQLSALVGLLRVQGILLALLAGLLGNREDSLELYAVGAGVLLLKGGVLPEVLHRALRAGGEVRETQPLVNVPASILAAALLTLLAYAASGPVVDLNPIPETRAVPVGLSMVLIGLFLLVSRRRAVAQVAGFLLMDNGIATTAFLLTAGVPVIVELAVSLDLLLVVLVLFVITSHVRAAFGGTDIDELQELRD
jgi:hydrogenase-4 component E